MLLSPPRISACLVAAVVLTPALLPAPPEDLKALETFDRVWEIVDRQHFDPNFNGVDWGAVRMELRPAAAEAENVAELRGVIGDMLSRLGQSHFDLIPKEMLRGGAAGSAAGPAGTCGLDLRWIAGEAVIVRVDPGPAEEVGIRPGWILRSIADVDFDELLLDAEAAQGLRPPTAMWKGLMASVDGEIGSTVELTFEDHDGAEHVVTLERIQRDAIPFDLPGLPTFFLQQRWDIFEHDLYSVGLLHFSNWFQPLLEPLDQALVEMRGCDAIILDLRGNTGGDVSVGTGLAGHFFEVRVSLGTQRSRRDTTELVVRPRRRFARTRAEPFTAPLAILVDETTGSCSEVFTGGMRALGRARVFGSRTAGAALRATLSQLPNGDSLLHAIAEFQTTLGEVLEGDGVLPDVVIQPRRADWAAGADRTMEAALEWLSEALAE